MLVHTLCVLLAYFLCFSLALRIIPFIFFFVCRFAFIVLNGDILMLYVMFLATLSFLDRLIRRMMYYATVYGMLRAWCSNIYIYIQSAPNSNVIPVLLSSCLERKDFWIPPKPPFALILRHAFSGFSIGLIQEDGLSAINSKNKRSSVFARKTQNMTFEFETLCIIFFFHSALFLQIRYYTFNILKYFQLCMENSMYWTNARDCMLRFFSLYDVENVLAKISSMHALTLADFLASTVCQPTQCAIITIRKKKKNNKIHSFT